MKSAHWSPWMNPGFAIILIGLATTISGTAQNGLDSSGNGLLNGPYFVRQVLTLPDANTSAITRAVSIIGTMTFDGKGGYSFTGQKLDSSTVSGAAAYSTSGVYVVSASGLVQIQSPIDSTDTEFGGIGAVGPSVVVASATEGLNRDVFVAIQAGSGVTNGSLQGSYRVGFIDFLQARGEQARDGYYTLTSNGNGSFGTVAVTGGMANQGNVTTNQSYQGVTYNAASGGFVVNFPNSSTPLTQLVSGQKAFFLSADGNILIGGGINGFDMIVGIRAVSGATNSMYQGTYFNAALEINAGNLANGTFIDALNGSTLGLGQGNILFHQRLAFVAPSPMVAVQDFTADSRYNFAADGTFNDQNFQWMLGANGQATVDVGEPPFYSMIVGFQAKQATGTGVFIDPLKIWNAASYAPITNSVAPGEYVQIYGTGLSAATLQALTFPYPTNLGNVQVTVNGRLARLKYVSPTQINLLVPYATVEPYATFQVTNAGTVSNQVTVYTNPTAPGVFALTALPDGSTFPPALGPAAVLHADFSLVTKARPARAGETLQLYVTGLGSVSPLVADGAAAPSSPLSTVDVPVSVEIQDTNGDPVFPCTVTFKGLAPGFAGLYQLNFTVPKGVPSGLQWVNVGTPDAYTTMAKLYTQ